MIALHEHHLEGRHSDRLPLIRRPIIPPGLWRPLISSGNTFISLWTLSAPGVPNRVEREADEAFTQDGEACVANVSSAYSQQPHRLQPCIRRLVVIGQLEDRQDFNVGKSCGEAPMPGWTPYSNEPVGWFVDSYSVRTYRPSDGDRPLQCTSDVKADNPSWIRQQNPAEI